APKRAGDGVHEREIEYDRLAAHEKLVGHHIPRADQDAPSLDGATDPVFLLGPNLEVILEHDRLPIEMKVGVRRVGVEQVEQPIDESDEPQAELLVGEITLAIPMRVRNDVAVQQQGV